MGKAQARPSEQSMEAKLETTRRRLYEGYLEYEDAKRRRTIQVIEAPEMARQRRKSQGSILRRRDEVRRAVTMAERRALVCSLLGFVRSVLSPDPNDNKVIHLV